MNTHGNLNLTVTSPEQTFVEPVTLAEMRDYLRMTSSDSTDHDVMISAMITAAREEAERRQGRELCEKQYDLSLDCFYDQFIPLLDPLVSVELVRYKDSAGTITTLAEGTDYIVDTASHPGCISPLWGQIWPVFVPWPSSAVLIRFTAGKSGVSIAVKEGIKRLVSGWYNNAIPFEPKATALQELPNDVSVLLSCGALRRF